MRIPDFFIIGAPKCGTSAIHRYLQAHPGVFMPRMKEPHFFSLDLPGRRDITDEGNYVRLFETAPPSAMTGEGSATYLFSEIAISEIMKRNPGARLIALLRNPIDAAYSYHSERLYNLSEYIDDFEEAWRLQEKRAQGQFISKYCRDAKLLQYRNVFSYASQVERLFDLVPAHQRLLIIFEDFREQPRETYLSILRFLGLPDDGRQVFPSARANRTLRSRRLAEWHRLLKTAPPNWYRHLEGVTNTIGIEPRKIISRINAKTVPRPPLAPHFRREITDEFAPDVRKLEQLLERRLDCWRDFRLDQAVPLKDAS